MKQFKKMFYYKYIDDMKRMVTDYIQSSETKSERLLHEQTIKLQPDNVRKTGLLTLEES